MTHENGQHGGPNLFGTSRPPAPTSWGLRSRSPFPEELLMKHITFTYLPTPQFMDIKPGHVPVGRASKIERGVNVPADLEQELAGRLPEGRGAPIALAHRSDIAAEGYELLVQPTGVQITASERRGFIYGLQRLAQITREGQAPLAEIRDFPSLPMRGFQVNFYSLRHLGVKGAVDLLDAMARWRLNTVLFEYGNRYPFARHEAICAGDALTREGLQTVLAHARSLGIEAIPLQQCLGHVEYVLCRDEYAHLREEDEKRDQWCPLRPQSFDLFCELVDDLVATHPGIRHLHIGGDEARRLGKCPECAQTASKGGPGRLYVDFVTKAIRYVKAQGLTPILWDDMLCRHSEVLDEMPRDAVVMYWEYWTTQHPSAIFVARPAGRGVVVDRRWKTEWASELDPVERQMIAHFAAPIDFERDFSPEFLGEFRRYLGEQFPKRVRAFPYLEYYQDMGFKVLCAPAGGSNHSTWRSLPDLPRYADNIAAFCQRAHEARALGVVTTSWYDFPVEGVTPSIMYTGQTAWNVATAGRTG
ncbi:MAG: hypothetical protein FJ279_22265 [Planctomycetes bacterium]|nr:hypothetical protein [Planctomycetota bacterium]